jgi:Tol biopolymer transport system component
LDSLLADRLSRGAISAEEALDIALGLGAALDKAHRQGRVHGFLSPNVVSLSGRTVNILPVHDAARQLAGPYLSPEQVHGQEPDWRSDIFSYGAILSDLASAHPAMAPVVAACMETDPALRRQRVQNAVIELKLIRRALRRTTGARPPAPKNTRTAAPVTPPEYWVSEASSGTNLRTLLVIGLAVLTLAASGLAAAMYLRKQAAPVMSFAVPAPDHTSYPGTPAVSPDGASLAFSAAGADGQRMLWLRSFDEMGAKVIPGTEGGIEPFWSPDGQYLGFFAHNALMKIRARANAPDAKPELLYAADFEPAGGTWNTDGSIFFAPNLSDGVYRISSNGGGFAPVLKLTREKGQRGDLWPHFLPDGKHFVYFGQTDQPETTGIYAASSDGARTQFLFRSTTNAIYSPDAGKSPNSGYLLFMRNRDLVVQSFNAARLELEGSPAVLASDIGAIETLSRAPISVSSNGVLVYQAVSSTTRRLVWMDRSGKTLSTLGGNGEWGMPRIAPDGVRAAADKAGKDGVATSIYIFGADGSATEFDAGTGASAGAPVWSPDGSRLAFRSTQNKVDDIFMKAVNAPGRAELVQKSDFDKFPVDWSRDSRWLLFEELSPQTRSDIWAASPAEKRAHAVLETVHSESFASLSPDRKWLAYQTDESGGYEVVVRPWDGGTAGVKAQWQISKDGGGMPHWRADGSELFFITAGGVILSVRVHPSDDEFAFDAPVPLFQTHPAGKRWNPFDVTPDGSRFLLNLPLEWSDTALNIVTNWTEKLAKDSK